MGKSENLEPGIKVVVGDKRKDSTVHKKHKLKYEFGVDGICGGSCGCGLVGLGREEGEE